ncbi:MAG: homoserine dehydrogenase [Clostridia bacterium]|nr:homoserine dehydrogenase [Clostridia bacterium]
MKIGLLGYGTVGSAFYALARERADTQVKKLLVLERLPGPDCEQVTDFGQIARDEEIDTVVELIGGLHPAYEFVTEAMRRGKNVVTANKLLVSACYGELIALAQKQGVALRCTAAAGGGIPWLRCLSRLAETDAIDEVSGIMNGSTNFILSAMTQSGEDYNAVLLEAQRLGYCEADPTADVGGFDAQRKLVISANIAFGVSLREAEVPCFGIDGITAKDIAYFKEKGLVCKLIAHAQKRGGAISACVEPMLFPESAQMAHVGGPDNLIRLHAGRVGWQSFSGAGAGGFATASNVLADCLEVKGGCPSFYTDRLDPAAVDNETLTQRYYVRAVDTVREDAEMTVAAAHRLAAEYRAEKTPFFMAALSEE